MAKSNAFKLKKHSKIPKIYMDYGAGADANASSVHTMGVEAKKILEKARGEVASVLHSRNDEMIFTSGGTEGNNIAIQGLVLSLQNKKDSKILPHVIITNIEHPSVLETCKMLEKRNMIQLSVVEVETNGIIDPKKIKKELRNNTALVSVMYANNEIGTIQPINEIAKEVRHFRKNKKIDSVFPLLHTDAVQAVNYLDLNVEKLGVDMLTLSGSKIKGAGRVGALFKKRTVDLVPVFYGGDQEMGLRPGTENLTAISRFAKALKNSQAQKQKEGDRLKKLKNYFINKLSKIPLGGGVIINGNTENSLPHMVSITFSKIPNELLVIELSAKGVMCSSKSACKSSQKGGSYVIQAINPNLDPEIGAVRFSFGKDTKKEDIDYTIKVLKDILSKLKKWYS